MMRWRKEKERDDRQIVKFTFSRCTRTKTTLQPDSRITKREADPDYYRPINLDDNHPLELKKCNADVSKCCPAMVNWARRSSCRCSLAHCLSQWVPLNNTCKKVFGLHLSKTTLFLVIQIVQHKADAAVNNNKLCMLPPALDQLTNKSSMLWGGDIPNIKCTTRHRNLA